MVKFKVVRLCKQEAMSIAPTELLRYDLEKAANLLEGRGFKVTPQGPMVIAKGEGFEATLYTSGRMLISQVETKEAAAQAAERIYEAVEGAREAVSPKKG